MGIASRQEYIYTRHQSLVALQFQTTIKTYARFRRLDRVEDFVREIFDLSFFFFSSISNFFFFLNLGAKRMRGNMKKRKSSDWKSWMGIVTIFGVLYANGIVSAQHVYERYKYFFSSISFIYVLLNVY